MLIDIPYTDPMGDECYVSKSPFGEATSTNLHRLGGTLGTIKSITEKGGQIASVLVSCHQVAISIDNETTFTEQIAIFPGFPSIRYTFLWCCFPVVFFFPVEKKWGFQIDDFSHENRRAYTVSISPRE